MEEDEGELRFERLETKLSYQEAAIADLGALVLGQERRIAQLEEKLKLAIERIKELGGDGLGPLPHNERPPHY